MVAEDAVLFDDLYIPDSGCIQDSGGGLGSGKSGGGGNLAGLGVGNLNFGRSPKGKGHCAEEGKQEESVHRFVILKPDRLVRKGCRI